jgi:DNA-binding NarL/FixJ family response regulator
VAIRVLVIDDHLLIREGLRRALRNHQLISIIGEAASKAEALAQIAHHNPEVIIVDLHLPDGSGLEVIAWARSLSQKIGIVALTASRLPEHVVACMQSGASAHVDKAAPLEELISAISRSFAAPLTFTPRKITAHIEAKDVEFQLTPRELEILGKLPTGDSIVAIAAQLFIAESTMKSHLQAIYRKLAVSGRVQAIARARKSGLLP